MAESKAKSKAADNKATAPGGDLVEVELFFDGEKYKDDVDICINGKRILLQRGKKIKIKRDYALVLEQSLKQDKRTKDMILKYVADRENAEATSNALK